jgi:uncharacterized protein YbjT (DUF2867 family)
MKILLAGATGAVGKATLALLRADGQWVRTLSRDANRAHALGADDVRVADAVKAIPADLCDGIDAVISCLGGNVSLTLAERRSYAKVDLVANRRLLAAAKTAGVKRFVYVSVVRGEKYNHTRYMRAHEAFVDDLKASGLAFSIIRPTGIFPALLPFLDMAKKGRAFVAGKGQTRTNPVSADDVAAAVLRGLDGAAEEINVGGPEIMARDDIAKKAFAAVGKPAKIMHFPLWLFAFGAFFLRLVHPRLGDFLQFVVAVSGTDSVADQVGTARLDAYFRSQV